MKEKRKSPPIGETEEEEMNKFFENLIEVYSGVSKERAREVSTFLPAKKRRENLEKILATEVREGTLFDAQKTAKLLGRKLTTKEIQRILRHDVNIGYFEGAQRVAEILGRKLTTKEIQRIIVNCIKYIARFDNYHTRIEQAKKAAQYLPLSYRDKVLGLFRD